MFCCIVRVHQDCCVLSYDPRHWQKRTYSWRGFYCYFSALYPFVSLATYVALTANCKQFGNRIASSFQGAFDGKIKKGTKYLVNVVTYWVLSISVLILMKPTVLIMQPFMVLHGQQSHPGTLPVSSSSVNQYSASASMLIHSLYRSKTTWMYYAHLDTLKVALLSASTYKSVKNTATGIDKYGASIRKIQRKLFCKFVQQTRNPS